jgi:hypothetical protein
MQGNIAPSGELTMQVTRAREFPYFIWPSVNRKTFMEHGLPHRGLPAEVNEWRLRNLRHLYRGAWRQAAAAKLGIPSYYGALWMTKRRGDTGEIVPLGLASMRVVTTAGVGYIVDAFQNLTEAENMKFHGFGTGSTAEASADTALVTELTTEYNPNSTRPTGTLAEGASANIFRTVATLTPDSGTPVLREHGIFSQAATGGGVLLDRTLFAAVTLDSSLGDSLQVTYELTFPAGS